MAFKLPVASYPNAGTYNVEGEVGIGRVGKVNHTPPVCARLEQVGREAVACTLAILELDASISSKPDGKGRSYTTSKNPNSMMPCFFRFGQKYCIKSVYLRCNRSPGILSPLPADPNRQPQAAIQAEDAGCEPEVVHCYILGGGPDVLGSSQQHLADRVQLQV